MRTVPIDPSLMAAGGAKAGFDLTGARPASRLEMRCPSRRGFDGSVFLDEGRLADGPKFSRS